MVVFIIEPDFFKYIKNDKTYLERAFGEIN